LRRTPEAGAGIQIIVHGPMKRRPQRADAIGMKSDDIPNPGNVSDQRFVLITVFN